MGSWRKACARKPRDFASAAEEWERISQDAGKRLQIPSQPRPEKERGIGGPVYLQFVFEQILQWQARQYLGLREGGGKHPGNDDQRRIGKSLIGPERTLVCYARTYHLPVPKPAIIADTKNRLPLNIKTNTSEELLA